MTLRRGNDWGQEYLAPSPHDERGYASARRAVRLVEGYSILVLWPSGEVTSEVITHRRSTQTVSDHGHSSSVTSEIPGFWTSLRGAAMWLPLDTEGLQVQLPQGS